jgi:hypothetical protein
MPSLAAGKSCLAFYSSDKGASPSVFSKQEAEDPPYPNIPVDTKKATRLSLLHRSQLSQKAERWTWESEAGVALTYGSMGTDLRALAEAAGEGIPERNQESFKQSLSFLKNSLRTTRTHSISPNCYLLLH